jgi:tripartite-type tricarboxylate transporter receptor subunit TctC
MRLRSLNFSKDGVAEIQRKGCATSGADSNQHILLEWFNQMAGIKLDHVPYRGCWAA